ncbi:hypothetical protein PilKf_00164 [Pillotina sp. SPG140]|jgi:hypothetical protein
MLTVRQQWRLFRRRFDDSRLCPILNYSHAPGNVFRFDGYLESFSEKHVIWIRNKTLTVPVSLENSQLYVFPHGSDNPPQRIQRNDITTLTEYSNIFVCGQLSKRNRQNMFVSTKEYPLIIIFYEGNIRDLTVRVIQCGRYKTEYWNKITPYSLICGVFSNLFIGLVFLNRPAFSLTVTVAFIALWTPLFSFIPPGIIFTLLGQHCWHQARIFRSYRDIVYLPAKYAFLNNRLPNGEQYGVLKTNTLALTVPMLVPIPQKKIKEIKEWYVFGAFHENDGPVQPYDFSAPYGALPGKPERLAQHYNRKALIYEIIAWISFSIGMALSTAFIVFLVFE